MGASWQRLARQYEISAHVATGLTVKFVAPQGPIGAIRFGLQENPFCALLQRQPGGCPFERILQQQLLQRVRRKLAPHLAHCPAGFVVAALPVLCEGEHIATLIAGHVRDPTAPHRLPAAISHVAHCHPARLLRVYQTSPAMTAARLRATVRLLSCMAEAFGKAVLRQGRARAAAESQPISAARAFATDHLAEPMRLTAVAQHVHLEPHYFCRLFHRETGETFGHYLARCRVARAKQLLSESALRISEIAFASGFGSIAQFNRIFRHWTGHSPTEYRQLLHGGGRRKTRKTAAAG